MGTALDSISICGVQRMKPPSSSHFRGKKSELGVYPVQLTTRVPSSDTTLPLEVGTVLVAWSTAAKSIDSSYRMATGIESLGSCSTDTASAWARGSRGRRHWLRVMISTGTLGKWDMTSPAISVPTTPPPITITLEASASRLRSCLNMVLR